MNQVKVYEPQGVCTRSISFTISETGAVHDVRFEGGCHGNTQGITRLVEGRQAPEVIERLRGICCKDKQTSCPDQLARALAAGIAPENGKERDGGSR